MQLKIGQKVRYKEEYLDYRPEYETVHNINEFTIVDIGDNGCFLKPVEHKNWWVRIDHLEPIPEPKEEGEDYPLNTFSSVTQDEIWAWHNKKLDLALQAERERIISLIKE